ncbi:MAG: NYN domain-containing protein [Lachnospira sp.]|nr:NYN domain-containing protein [Lachnospira sp.]
MNYDDNKVNFQKKRNTVVFIDAESVNASHCSSIVSQSKKAGEVAEMKYYARQKDPHTKAWKDAAKENDIKPILMAGNPEHNKIDNKLIKDAKKILRENKSIDVFCIASRDGDYTELVNLLRENKKRVVILATKDTSQKLKASASEVKEI